MKLNKENLSISYEEALQMPELAHLHDTLRYLEHAPDSEILPEKYAQSLEYQASKQIQNVFKNSPTLSLKDVVANVIENLPNDISATHLLKITPYIIKKWENLQESTYQNKPSLA